MAQQRGQTKRRPPKGPTTRSTKSQNSRDSGRDSDDGETTMMPLAKQVHISDPADAEKLSSLVTRYDFFGQPPDHAAKLEAICEKNRLLSEDIRRRSFAAAIRFSEWSNNWIPANSFMETVQLRSRVVLLLSLHFVACLLVWQHFFYNKLRRNIAVIHDDEPNFELKRLGPAVEFGLMHVTLLQLCLLPLTVSRSLLAWIATKTSILPMEHMMRLHIQCGYFCCLSVIFGACLYIGFVGHLCQEEVDGHEHEDEFCKRFKTEIFITGLFILASNYILVITGYLRGRMVYENFFAIHVGVVGFLYCMVLVHTFDDEVRKQSFIGKRRPQTFRWIIGSLGIFLADRAWRYYTQGSNVPVIESVIVPNAKAFTMKIIKPWWFNYVSGHHIHIQVPEIDIIWHPFSIASEPQSNLITIIIEVIAEEQWTGKVAAMLRAGSLTSVNIRGPFGTPIGPAEGSVAAANVVVVGSGTGIVPMLSLLKSRIRKLRQLSVEELNRHYKTLVDQETDGNLAYILNENVSEHTTECIRHIQLCHRKRMLDKYDTDSLAPLPVFLSEAQELISTGRWWVFKTFFLLVLICCDFATAGLTISFNTVQRPAFITQGMADWLKALNLFFIFPFAVIVYVWYRYRTRAEKTAILYVHALMVLAMFGINAMLIAYGKFEQELSAIEVAALVFFSIWRMFAVYSIQKIREPGLLRQNPIETFRVLWVCNNSNLIVSVLDDLEVALTGLDEQIHGGKNTKTVGTKAFPQIDLHVWCTDKNAKGVEMVKEFIADTRYENVLQFSRPNMTLELVTSMREIIMAPSFHNRLRGETLACTVTFCGSNAVSDATFRAVQMCHKLAEAAGAYEFTWIFSSQSLNNMPSRHTHHGSATTADHAREWYNVKKVLGQPDSWFSRRGKKPASHGKATVVDDLAPVVDTEEDGVADNSGLDEKPAQEKVVGGVETLESTV